MTTTTWIRCAVGALLALGLLGCPEEGPPPATPIAPMGPPPGPPGPPVRPPPPPKEEPPPPKEEPKEAPKAPATPAGLTRSKVGDQVEYAWTRIGGEVMNPMDQANAMAMIQGSGGKPDMDKIRQMAQGMKPEQSKKTGTVVVTRTEPESPFTFRVDVKSGKDTETRHFAYTKDIPLHEVVFHTDATDPRKQQKVAGADRDVVLKESRVLAPDVDGLALGGGLVSEVSPEQTQGAVSVTLTRFGTTKTAAAPGEKPKALESFETPISVAIKAIAKFGIVDPEEKLAREAKLSEDIQAAVQPCMKDARPESGTLQGSIAGGKLESLMWAGGMPPKAFDKCLREKIKKLKLPQDETFLSVQLPGDK